MSDPYERAKTGRLTFKGGSLATLQSSIDKKKKKKHKKNKQNKSTNQNPSDEPQPSSDEIIAGDDVVESNAAEETVGDIYTIDAAKRMKYDELFPVEAKKFGYEPKAKEVSKSVEDALDDRVKKKADRYCK